MVELFGTAAGAAMVAFYTLDGRGPGFTFAFAASCLAAAGYAVIIGSWPFFVLESVWAGVAALRGVQRLRVSRGPGSLPERN
jgi:hypothetical protein